MEQINFIVIKTCKNATSDMYVFTKDGKEAAYPIFDGKKSIKSSYLQLKKLAEQNGINFSSAGLRELRRLNLLYYMGEEEFDRVHKAMSLENENQAHYQKVKEQSQSDFEEKWFQSFLSTIEKNPSLLFKSMENPYFNVKFEKKQLPQKYNPISDYLIPIKEKEINFIVIESSKDRKATMHVFTDDGEEAAYPIFDGKNLVKSSYVQLEKLAKQNGINFSPAGLKELKDLGLIHYMTEEKFEKVHETISQENKNRAKQQKEKGQLQQKNLVKEQLAAFEKEWLQAFLSNIEKNPSLLFGNNRNSYFNMEGVLLPKNYSLVTTNLTSSKEKQSDFTGNGADVENSSKQAAGDALDYSKVQVFKTKERKKSNSGHNTTSKPTSIVGKASKDTSLNTNSMNIPEFKQHVDSSTRKDSPRNKKLIKQLTIPMSNRKITFSKEILDFIKEKKVGIIGSITSAAVVITLATTYAKMDSCDLKDELSITEDVNKATSENNGKNNESKKTSEPTPTDKSDIGNVPRYSSFSVKAGGVDEYQTITDALNNATINTQKKVHLSRIYSWLNYFNDSFANHYYSKKEDTKPAHRWTEAVVDYLLFNNIGHTTAYNIFDTYTLDTDQLLKVYKKGIDQDTQAYIISEESLRVDQLINSERGKEFYKVYKKLFKKYKSLTKDSKYTKEEVVNTFSKLIREDFLTAGKEITSYKLAVLPIINAFYELSSNIDAVEKLSQAELDYVNEKMLEKAESKLGEYSNGLIVNRELYGDVCVDDLSYKGLKKLAIDELKEKNNYQVETKKRDITGQKAYQKIVESLTSKKDSSTSDYSSYYKSTKEIKEPFLSLKSSNKPLSEEEDKMQHGSMTKSEKQMMQESSIEALARCMVETMVNGLPSRNGTSFVKRKK